MWGGGGVCSLCVVATSNNSDKNRKTRIEKSCHACRGDHLCWDKQSAAFTFLHGVTVVICPESVNHSQLLMWKCQKILEISIIETRMRGLATVFDSYILFFSCLSITNFCMDIILYLFIYCLVKSLVLLTITNQSHNIKSLFCVTLFLHLNYFGCLYEKI